jgi:hypothetical protein
MSLGGAWLVDAVAGLIAAGIVARVSGQLVLRGC